MKKILSICCALILLLPALRAQYTFNFQQEYFFGNLPYAKAEAMGRAQVAVGGAVSSQFFNSAGIGLIEEQEVALSTSAPFYLLRESDFYYAGYARRVHSKVVAAVSVNQLAIGPTSFSTEIGGTRFELDNPKTTNLALTAAAEPIKGLHVGVNANFLGLKYFESVSAFRSLMLDAGVLYQLPLSTDPVNYQRFQFAASVNNLNSATVTLESPQGDEAIQNLPTFMRVAVAYLVGTQLNLPGAGQTALDLTLTGEYQNVLNSDFRTGINAGAEGVFARVFALRLGYVTHTLDDRGVSNNRDRLSDFTYGFGFIVPLSELSKGKLPFDAHLDYVSLRQPPFVFSGRRIPNMRTYGLRLVWVPFSPKN